MIWNDLRCFSYIMSDFKCESYKQDGTDVESYELIVTVYCTVQYWRTWYYIVMVKHKTDLEFSGGTSYVTIYKIPISNIFRSYHVIMGLDCSFLHNWWQLIPSWICYDSLGDSQCRVSWQTTVSPERWKQYYLEKCHKDYKILIHFVLFWFGHDNSHYHIRIIYTYIYIL